MGKKAQEKQPQALEEILPSHLQTETVTCEKHGEQRIVVFNVKNQSKECPECISERLRLKETALGHKDAVRLSLRASGVKERHLDATIDNYTQENEGQIKAVKACKWFMQSHTILTGLVFLGRPGTGKNHLAVGLMREYILLGKTAKILSFLDYMREIKEGYSTGVSERTIVNKYTRPDFLVLDEIGRQFRSETESIMLHDLIDKRYQAMKQTLLITNLDVDGLKEVTDVPALNRFFEGAQGQPVDVRFDWESYRKKKEVL